MIVLVILTVPIVKERLLLVEPAMLELLSECAPRMYCVMTRGGFVLINVSYLTYKKY